MSETRETQSVLVRAIRQESVGVHSVELDPVDGVPIAWEPGAHIDLMLPDGTARQYSVSGATARRGVRIAVLHNPDGRGGSDWVHSQLRVGHTIEITPPRNHFALEPASGYAFIAGGIGITPILPMIEAAERSGVPYSLAYAGRSRAGMAFLDEVAAYGNGAIIAVGEEGDRLDVGALLGGLVDGALVYACGPQRLLDAVEQVLEAAGRGHILRRELFAVPDGDGLPISSDNFTVELRRSGLSVSVSPGQSVLAAVTAAGIDVLTDCEEGICGSCETGVLEGEVEHRDYVLTTQEKARNDCMMICVSRAACPVLVLDL
ncbi:MAG: oxidoreductase [Glaciihabitans sp.]|nr:oxidoreductase [Glaciihabitans sp.]